MILGIHAYSLLHGAAIGMQGQAARLAQLNISAAELATLTVVLGQAQSDSTAFSSNPDLVAQAYFIARASDTFNEDSSAQEVLARLRPVASQSAWGKRFSQVPYQNRPTAAAERVFSWTQTRQQQDIIRTLISIVSDSTVKSMQRARAAHSLGEMRISTDGVLDALVAGIESAEEILVVASALAMGKIGSPSALAQLINVLGVENETPTDHLMKRNASEAIRMFGVAAVPSLVEELTSVDADMPMRLEAARLLGGIKDPAAIDGLLQAYRGIEDLDPPGGDPLLRYVVEMSLRQSGYSPS